MKNTTTEEGEEKHLPAAETASHDSKRERAGGYAVDGVKRGGNPSEFAPSPTCRNRATHAHERARSGLGSNKTPDSAVPREPG
jgi:hypothetical protein